MGTLYENIAKLCEEKGIKGGKMCTDLSISKGLLTDLKMGRRSGISAKTADKIANYFGVSVSYLLGTEKAPVPENSHESIEQQSSKSDEQSKESLPRPKIRSLARLESAELSENEDIEIANFIDFILSKKDRHNGTT